MNTNIKANHKQGFKANYEWDISIPRDEVLTSVLKCKNPIEKYTLNILNNEPYKNVLKEINNIDNLENVD